MAKYDIKVNEIITNDDGHLVARGTLDGAEFEAVSKEQDADGRDLFKVGGTLEENQGFGRGARIALARACRKGVTMDEDPETTEEVGAQASADDTIGGQTEDSLGNL